MRPLLFLILALLSVNATAQDAAVPLDPELLIPADDFDRGTPRRSADGFMAAIDQGDYESATEYLDLRNLRGAARDLTAAQLARRLFVIIQRAEWVDVDELVDDPAGRSNDGLPDYRDSIGVVLDEERELRLLMQKVPRGDGVFIWKVSNATVSLIPDLYEEYGYPEMVESVRRTMPNVTFLGFELFKWVIVLVVAAAVYAAVFLLALTIRRMAGDRDRPSHRRVFRFMVLPLGIWLVIIAANSVATMLGRGSLPNSGSVSRRFQS